MFGGFTHEPAIELARLLVEITPPPLQRIFFADSGSVAVEVAIKMAIQFWHASGAPQKSLICAPKRAYHGDTIGAMGLCDPVDGMHALFSPVLASQLFIHHPTTPFGETLNIFDDKILERTFKENHHRMAAFILEPLLQGAGGMHTYSAAYVAKVRELCDRWSVLFIADEIATGFGRTGELFACTHAKVSPDILCLGKALTGGTLSLAAVLATEKVAQGVSAGGAPLMHGPTFMANPLACAVALASTQLLLSSPWRERVATIEEHLRVALTPLSTLKGVAHVRVLGAMGALELDFPVHMKIIQPLFVEAGVWIRPFGKTVYLMPPYILSKEELKKLTDAVCTVLTHYLSLPNTKVEGTTFCG